MVDRIAPGAGAPSAMAAMANDGGERAESIRSSQTSVRSAAKAASRSSWSGARGVAAGIVLGLTGMTMAGCAMAGRATLEQARADTEAAMQRIADEIPGGVVEVRAPDSAYLACDGGGYYSINRLAVTPQPGFDGEA